MKEGESWHLSHCLNIQGAAMNRYGPNQDHNGGQQDAYDGGYFVKDHKQELTLYAILKNTLKYYISLKTG